MKKYLKYALIIATGLILNGVLINLGEVGFGIGAGIAVLIAMTLNMTDRQIPAAIYSALAFALDCLILPKTHIGVYGIALFAATLAFFAVWLSSKYEYGTFLSAGLGIAAGYLPIYFGIKYLGKLFLDTAEYDKLSALTHYPLMIGFVCGVVLAFFAVPAVRVFDNRKNGDKS